MIGEPLSIGIPATHTLSFTPTRLPASGPSAAPGIEHFHAHPLDGLSAPVGRWPRSARAYFTGRFSSVSSSRRVKPASVAGAATANVSSSSSLRSKRNSRAMRCSSWREGGWTGTATSCGVGGRSADRSPAAGRWQGVRHRARGGDEPEVTQRLREVAEEGAVGRVDLLGIEADVVREAGELVEQRGRLVGPAGGRQRLDEPERARQERALALDPAGQAV